MPEIRWLLSELWSLRSLFDVLVVSLLIFWLLGVAQGTRATSLIRGAIIFLAMVYILATVFDLETLNWILARTWPALPIDAKLTRQLLINIFYPNSPLHDGAVLTSGDRIVAASVVLPLTDNISASSQLGTRHRAAIGVTEDSDALAVVVSEETGQIAVAHSGRLIRGLDQDRLRRVLRTLMRLDREEPAGGATAGRFHLPSAERVRV